MNYKQVIENATTKLWDLLDKNNKTETIQKEEIRKIIKELEKDL